LISAALSFIAWWYQADSKGTYPGMSKEVKEASDGVARRPLISAALSFLAWWYPVDS